MASPPAGGAYCIAFHGAGDQQRARPTVDAVYGLGLATHLSGSVYEPEDWTCHVCVGAVNKCGQDRREAVLFCGEKDQSLSR